MLAVVAVISALWFVDNAEFLETVSEQRAEGATWHQVGWQDHEAGLPAITIDSNDQKHIVWKLKHAKDSRVD